MLWAHVQKLKPSPGAGVQQPPPHLSKPTVPRDPLGGVTAAPTILHHPVLLRSDFNEFRDRGGN